MFHVIFNSRYENSISTLTIPFETEEQADEAILHFEEQSTSYIAKTANRLYKESFEYSIDWSDGTIGTFTNVVRGYDKRHVGDEFIKKHNNPSISIINIKKHDKTPYKSH